MKCSKCKKSIGKFLNNAVFKYEGHYIFDGLTFCSDCWEKRTENIKNKMAQTQKS